MAECFVVKGELFRVFQLHDSNMLSCFGRRFFSFFLLLHLVGIVSVVVNKAVKFKAVLLAFKSNIFYRLNPSTKGSITDPPLVPFEAALSWAMFS